MVKCDYCDKEATYNYQKVWKKYKVLNKGYEEISDFDPMDIEEPTGEDNYHLCYDHSKMFEETGYSY
jgi:hypothetical protein